MVLGIFAFRQFLGREFYRLLQLLKTTCDSESLKPIQTYEI